jgi:hypothetical protein
MYIRCRGNVFTEPLLARQEEHIGTDIKVISQLVEFDRYTFHLQTLRWMAVESGFNFQQVQEIVIFATAFRLALGPNNSLMQWVSVTLSPGRGKGGRGVKLTTRLYLIPR